MRIFSSRRDLCFELEFLGAYLLLGHSVFRTFVTMTHEYRLLNASRTLLFASCGVSNFVTKYRTVSGWDERKRYLVLIAITLLALVDNTAEFAINWSERP